MKTNFTLIKKNLHMQLLPVVVFLLSSTMLFGQSLHVIEVRDFQFDPNELEITAGDTVEWRNEQGSHNVNGTQETYPQNPESFGNAIGTNWTYQYVFTTPGSYSYQCDPHATVGMNGSITVLENEGTEEEYLLTVEFSGMDPHEGQNIYLAVREAGTGMETGRTQTVAESGFTMEVSGIESGKSYHVDFWADFNENGRYDTPPVDHAWRLELDNVTGDTTLMFVHNTDFTNIMWQNLLTVEFSGMNPHVGQDIYLAVVDMASGTEVGRTHTVGETDFTLTVPGIEAGNSYYVDFWADHNQNGMYDTPPADHAWRIELNDVMGDTTLMFAHNTDFTDIMWKNLLTVEFSGMDPHVGQDIYLAVVDVASGMEIGRTHAVADTDFSIMVPGIEADQSYHVDFWADFNENGMYDTPPTDHAWRLELNDAMGDTTLMFVHNTDFTDIMWENQLTVEFTGMTPHVGQMFVLYVVNADDETVVDSVTVEEIAGPDFSVHSSSLAIGGNYYINFYADFNENGMYDVPPTDHAWQLMLENAAGDTTLMFAHNTDFTDIFPLTSAPEIGSRSFSMYPNPATDKVWIESDKLNTEDYSLSVFDISGRLASVKQAHRNDRIEFSVQNLTKGIYFVELKTTYDRKVMKLIKK